MSKKDEIIQKLRQEADNIEIPQGIHPENMRCKLEQLEKTKVSADKKIKTEKRRFKFPIKYMSTAACFVLLLLGMATIGQQGRMQPKTLQNTVEQTVVMEEPEEDLIETDGGEEVEELAEMSYPSITYEDIYVAMLPSWEEQGWFYTASNKTSESRDFQEMVIVEESVSTDGTATKLMSELMNETVDASVGTTNVQTVGVDEGDIIKNDGRYLYQVVYTPSDKGGEYAIQIVDTQDGLKEMSRVGSFNSIREFYVTDGLLIVVENKYRQEISDRTAQSAKVYDLICFKNYENCYHEITVYDLSNRQEPQKIKTFTMEGNYESSRVTDGYFYGFSRHYATPGDGKADYDAYIPKIDGVSMDAERILLPEKGTGTSYLVLISIDLNEPDKIYQSTAVVAESDLFYVSAENIYVTFSESEGGEEGWVSDKTAILRFGYEAGEFTLRAEGEVKGTLESSFSLDEYNGYLRTVSTVREYRLKKLVDDRTGKLMGSSVEEERQTNALYVLNSELEIVGSVEDLAEDERIYSARFLGDTGYFVTFRQTDPLFAVDLTNPEQPQILSELKISGFSEYLHFYGEDRLLGIGMEADENTGAQKGIKLSMFDISDPGNVKEIKKLWLEEFNHSMALYNHRAVLINTQANIFGFEAEGSRKGNYCKEYLLFSYEDENFVTRLKLDTKTEDGYYQSRGTFIGDVFYLLSQDGSVQSYNWKTGQKLESLN